VQRAVGTVETPPSRPAAAPPPIIRLPSGMHPVMRETAVSSSVPVSPAPEVVAEMDTQPGMLLPRPLATAPQAETAVPAPAEAIQRAVAAAEASPMNGPVESPVMRAAPLPWRVQAWPVSLPDAGLLSAGKAAASLPVAVAPSLPVGSVAIPHTQSDQTGHALDTLAAASFLNQPGGGSLPSAPVLATPPTLGVRALAAQRQPDAVQRVVATAEAPVLRRERGQAALSVPLWPEVAETAVSPASSPPMPPTISPAPEPPAAEAAPTVSAQIQRQPTGYPSADATSRPWQMLQRDETTGDKSAVEDLGYAVLSDLLQDEEPEARAEQETAVDVEELARQVYQKLRRRLAIERERERGRL